MENPTIHFNSHIQQKLQQNQADQSVASAEILLVVRQALPRLAGCGTVQSAALAPTRTTGGGGGSDSRTCASAAGSLAAGIQRPKTAQSQRSATPASRGSPRPTLRLGAWASRDSWDPHPLYNSRVLAATGFIPAHPTKAGTTGVAS